MTREQLLDWALGNQRGESDIKIFLNTDTDGAVMRLVLDIPETGTVETVIKRAAGASKHGEALFAVHHVVKAFGQEQRVSFARGNQLVMVGPDHTDTWTSDFPGWNDAPRERLEAVTRDIADKIIRPIFLEK